MRVGLVGLVALLVGASATSDPVPLRWKLAKGDVFFARSVQEMQQAIGVLGMNKDTSTTTTTTVRYKVLEAGADGLTLEQTVQKVEITGDNPAGADQGDKMKGATLTFKLDKDLKVTELVGYDAYVEKLSGGSPEQAQVLRAAAGEETLKVAVQDLLSPGPGTPVKPGDKWTRDTKLPLGPLGTFTVNARYTLDGLDGAVAKVSYDADASFAPGKGGEGGLPFQITKGELKADKYAGTLAFDTAAGRLRETAQNVKLNGTLTVTAGGMEIELTLAQTIKVTATITDKDPGD